MKLMGSTVNSTVNRSRIGPTRENAANAKGPHSAIASPNATTIAAMQAAHRGEVQETSLAELARLWEGACAKSSRPRGSRKT